MDNGIKNYLNEKDLFLSHHQHIINISQKKRIRIIIIF